MNSTRGFSAIFKAVDMNIGFIGAGNLALYVSQGLIRSGMHIRKYFLVAKFKVRTFAC